MQAKGNHSFLLDPPTLVEVMEALSHYNKGKTITLSNEEQSIQAHVRGAVWAGGYIVFELWVPATKASFLLHMDSHPWIEVLAQPLFVYSQP